MQGTSGQLAVATVGLRRVQSGETLGVKRVICLGQGGGAVKSWAAVVEAAGVDGQAEGVRGDSGIAGAHFGGIVVGVARKARPGHGSGSGDGVRRRKSGERQRQGA